MAGYSERDRKAMARLMWQARLTQEKIRAKQFPDKKDKTQARKPKYPRDHQEGH